MPSWWGEHLPAQWSTARSGDRAHRGTAEIGLAVMATTSRYWRCSSGRLMTASSASSSSLRADDTFADVDVDARGLYAGSDALVAVRAVITRPRSARGRGWAVVRADGPCVRPPDRGYHRVLGLALNNPWKTLGVAAAVFVASLSAATVMGTEFVPIEDRGEFQAIVELPPGTSFDESVATVARVEREIRAIPEVTQVFSTVGVGAGPRVEPARPHHEKGSARSAHRRDKEQVRAMLADVPFVDGKVAIPSSCRARRTSRRSTSSFAATTWRRCSACERDPDEGPCESQGRLTSAAAS